MPDRKDISSWHAALLDAHLFCKKRCSLKTQAPPSLRLLSRICGSTDHSIMLVGGVLLLCVGVIGFLCLCSYAALKVPEWSAMEMLSLFSAQKLGGRRFLGASFYFCIHKKTGFSRLGCIFFIFNQPMVRQEFSREFINTYANRASQMHFFSIFWSSPKDSFGVGGVQQSFSITLEYPTMTPEKDRKGLRVALSLGCARPLGQVCREVKAFWIDSLPLVIQLYMSPGLTTVDVGSNPKLAWLCKHQLQLVDLGFPWISRILSAFRSFFFCSVFWTSQR